MSEERGFDFIVGGIEDGIIDTLKAALLVTPQGGYLKSIEGYSGELDADQLRKALGDLTPRLPLMLVSYGEGEDTLDPATAPFQGMPRSYRHDCTFTVICVSGNARGEKARRRGSTGVYKMIADVRRLLGGVKLKGRVAGTDEMVTLNPEPFRYGGVEYIAQLPELTAYAVHFDTYFRHGEPDRSQPGQPVRELVITIENTFEKGESNLPGVTIG
ncbi:MAG TPA: phage protein Gp37 [Blastocatellia bacterium]